MGLQLARCLAVTATIQLFAFLPNVYRSLLLLLVTKRGNTQIVHKKRTALTERCGIFFLVSPSTVLHSCASQCAGYVATSTPLCQPTHSPCIKPSIWTLKAHARRTTQRPSLVSCLLRSQEWYSAPKRLHFVRIQSVRVEVYVLETALGDIIANPSRAISSNLEF